MQKDAKIVTVSKNTYKMVSTIAFKNHPLQKVELLSDHKGLHYKCTCTNRKKLFCEHVVAVCLKAIEPKNETET